MNMTKEEAIEAMRHGDKVTHKYFTSDEYMFIPDPRYNIYEFEDGVKMSGIEFWEIRDKLTFQNGWSLFLK